MKKYKSILALDPSGNYTEGKGTTGWCLFDAEQNKIITTGFLEADKSEGFESYWDWHLGIIDHAERNSDSLMVVIEDYVLYAHKSNAQINSKMETPKLIGVLQHYCWQEGIPYKMQLAAEVKNRWTDEILVHKGYLEKAGNRHKVNGHAINRHVKDSIRHAVHFNTFKNEVI